MGAEPETGTTHPRSNSKDVEKPRRETTSSAPIRPEPIIPAIRGKLRRLPGTSSHYASCPRPPISEYPTGSTPPAAHSPSHPSPLSPPAPSVRSPLRPSILPANPPSAQPPSPLPPRRQCRLLPTPRAPGDLRNRLRSERGHVLPGLHR